MPVCVCYSNKHQFKWNHSKPQVQRSSQMLGDTASGPLCAWMCLLSASEPAYACVSKNKNNYKVKCLSIIF